MKDKFNTWFKFLLCFNTVAFGVTGSYLNIGVPMTPNVVLVDYMQEFFEPLNLMIRDDENLSTSIIITNNVLLVITIVNTLFTVARNGKVVRYFTAITWLYSLRFFFVFIAKLPIPIGYTWSYPGLPEFAREYLIIKGMFFSL
jgi:hypothetical protein